MPDGAGSSLYVNPDGDAAAHMHHLPNRSATCSGRSNWHLIGGRSFDLIGENRLLDALNRVTSQSGQHVYRVELGSDSHPLPVVLKVYNPRSAHSLRRRLRRSRAIAEGRGYRAFARRGLLAAELVVYGERRAHGLWQQGIVGTRLINAPTVAEAYRNGRSFDLLKSFAQAVARIHAAGLSHGDPFARNFLATTPEVTAIDLCLTHRISRNSRRSDVIKFLGSAAAMSCDEKALRDLLRIYESGTSRVHAAERLLPAARDYAAQIGRP